MACRVSPSSSARALAPPKCLIASAFCITERVNLLDLRCQADLPLRGVKLPYNKARSMSDVTLEQIRGATTLSARLKLALAAKGMSPASLAKAIQVKRQTVYYWVDGTTRNIDSGNLARAARALGVRPEWLQHGGDVMFPQPELGEEEIQLVGFFQAMSPDKREALMDSARTYAERSQGKPTTAAPYKSKVSR